MKNRTLIIVIVIAIAALVYFLFFRKKNTTATATVENPDSVNNANVSWMLTFLTPQQINLIYGKWEWYKANHEDPTIERALYDSINAENTNWHKGITNEQFIILKRKNITPDELATAYNAIIDKLV